ILGIIFSIVWVGIYYFSKEISSFFASSKLKVYNIKNLLGEILFSYFIAVVEICTVKVFMSYYLKRSKNGYSI
ncbi:hypothetical protein J7L87_04645, partial [bacterium]|nr:hypothetical protein [bacterium]